MLDELAEPGADGRLGAVGVDEHDGPLLLLVGGVLPHGQHHTVSMSHTPN